MGVGWKGVGWGLARSHEWRSWGGTLLRGLVSEGKQCLPGKQRVKEPFSRLFWEIYNLE